MWAGSVYTLCVASLGPLVPHGKTRVHTMIPKPTPGHWYWKEDTKTLEFSRPPNISLQKYSEFTELDKPSKTLRLVGMPDNSCVTLEDVKRVALRMLEEKESNSIASFCDVEGNQFMNEFLMALLNYLSCFLEKHYNEKKHKTFMLNNILVEKEDADLKTKTEIALKHFARLYCFLVLGGIGEHHLDCGKSRGSATKRDRIFYESFYNYCIKVAWVVFRRKELTLIKEEVGRLLRSNTFNPALHKSDTPLEPSRNLSGQKTSKKTATHTATRRIQAKRLALHSIVTQLSPALASLLPSSKERSQYLFQKHELHPKGSAKPVSIDSLLEPSTEFITPRIGILGEQMKLFNRHTLLPIGAEEEEEQENNDKHSESFHSSRQSGHHSPFRPATGRQSMVISRATTEAAYSDND